MTSFRAGAVPAHRKALDAIVGGIAARRPRLLKWKMDGSGIRSWRQLVDMYAQTTRLRPSALAMGSVSLDSVPSRPRVVAAIYAPTPVLTSASTLTLAQTSLAHDATPVATCTPNRRRRRSAFALARVAAATSLSIPLESDHDHAALAQSPRGVSVVQGLLTLPVKHISHLLPTIFVKP